MFAYTLSLSENFPPNITAESTIVATVGELFYYQVIAVDPEGGNVSYSLEVENITANISSGEWCIIIAIYRQMMSCLSNIFFISAIKADAIIHTDL